MVSLAMPQGWPGSAKLIPSKVWNVPWASSKNSLNRSKFLLASQHSQHEKLMNTPIMERNTGCLLVIDDQEANIQVVGAVLGKLGFQILPATSCPQSLKRLSTPRPQLIRLDLLIPDMAGLELSRHIRQ